MNYNINKIYLFAIGAVLVSCNVTKPYKQPDLQLPTQYNTVAYSDTANIANMPWREFFTDTTLRSLIEKGIAYNYDLQLAVKRIESAQQQLQQAKTLQLPTLNASVSGQYNRPSKNSLNGSFSEFTGSSHYEDYILGLNLSWEADIWGKLRSQKKAAMLQYLQTYEAKKTVQTQLIADIADGYYNLLMLDEQLRIAKANLALADSTLKLTALLKEAGDNTQLSVEQTEAQRQTVAVLIPQLEQQVALQENALNELIGHYPQGIARQTSLSDIALSQQLQAGIPAAVVGHRPDVRSTEIDVMIANEKIGVAQANMYPNFNITASGGWESLKTGNWFNIPASLFGIVTGTIAQPILNHRENKTNLEVAKINREQAVIKFRQSVLGAVTDVSNALVQIDKLGQQEKINALQVHTLDSAIDHANMLYKSGMANYLEVITAQNSSLQSKLDLASVHCQQLVAAVALYKSVGGGWE